MNKSDHATPLINGKAAYGKSNKPPSRMKLKSKNSMRRSPDDDDVIGAYTPTSKKRGIAINSSSITPPTTTTVTRVTYPPDSPTKKRHSPRKPMRPAANFYSSPVGKAGGGSIISPGLLLPSAPLSPGRQRLSPARRGRTFPYHKNSKAASAAVIVQRRLLRTTIVCIGVSLTLIPFMLHSKVLQQQQPPAVEAPDAPVLVTKTTTTTSTLRKTRVRHHPSYEEVKKLREKNRKKKKKNHDMASSTVVTEEHKQTSENVTGGTTVEVPLARTQTHDTTTKKEEEKKKKERKTKTTTATKHDKPVVPQQEEPKQAHFDAPDDRTSPEHVAKIHARLQAALAHHDHFDVNDHNNDKKDNGKKKKKKKKQQQEEHAFLGSDGTLQAQQPLLPEAKKRPPPVSKIQVVRRTNAAGTPKFAYAYFLGGCDAADPSAYRGFIYNIVLSVYLQHQEGSNADTVIFVQMANSSKDDALPQFDINMLRAQNNIRIEYLPKNPNESLDQLMLEKFRILSLTEYDRVMYMDSDVMARGKLDYIMDLSMKGKLKENVIFAGSHVPASGALFMVTPKENDYERIQQIMASGFIDATKGWGHSFQDETDSYEVLSGQKKRSWDFPGASGDHGLLYHWVKYEKQSVSIIMKKKVQNWGIVGQGDDDKKLALQEEVGLEMFLGHHHECWAEESGPCLAPFTTFHHFNGGTKPWLSDAPESLANVSNPTAFWFHMLTLANGKHNFGINFAHWKPQHRPLLGLHSETLDDVKDLSTVPAARFAYAYVVGGCDPDKPAYRRFVYDILINTHLQREEGSQADVVVFFQMLSTSAYDALPKEDLRLLNEMNIKIHYIPKSKDESFDQLMMEKFRVLGLTQYERVIFLDSDVMVRGSFDYLFDLSVEGVLKKNVIFVGRYVPASGDIFMVEPKEGHWDRVLDIIRDKEDRGNKLPFPHWDVKKGWGHEFVAEGDFYELNGGSQGTAWDFLGAFSDQGFLYNWVKYEEQDFSIVMKKSIQNWGVGVNGTLQLEETLDLNAFDGLTVDYECWKDYLGHKPCKAPHSGYVHFTGQKKPWLHAPPEHFVSKEDASGSAEQFWYHILSVLNDKMHIGIEFDKWNSKERPLLGMHPNNVEAVPRAQDTGNDVDSKATSKFAYAYVVGGCDPNDPAYRSFIHAILVNTYLMRKEGSEADVVIFFQMAYASPYVSLPDEDLRVLRAMNIKIQYIPKTEDESFERLMLDKFRILSLTQYDRVIYLDSDVMVRGSMDYFFQLSMEGSIKENLVIGGRIEPAIGTIFMVAPKMGDWDGILDVIRDREERGDWNETLGWGHEFKSDEVYEMINGKKKNKWDFAGASADQGLLYHWVRFVKKSLTIVMKNKVQNWGVGQDGHARHEKTFDINVFTSLATTRECWAKTLGHKPCTAPHSDWIHWPGLKKPWLHGPPTDLSPETASSSPVHFWYQTLSEVNGKLDMGLDFKHWNKHHRPLLGVFGAEGLEGTAYTNTATDVIVDTPYSKPWNSTAVRRFAYAYVVGGCKPEDPSYRNYFNDIMISTYVQREEGSQADVVVFIQMAFGSDYDKLPAEDLRLLNAMDIKIEYIPKAQDESFYRTMLDKFLILRLTQYERILFMDGDVMARGQMDYLFDLSVQGVLKENLVTAGITEPANGGIFMVKPSEGAWDRILKIISDKEERGAKMPYPHWDEHIGWGHPFEIGEYYELGFEKKGYKWDFYGAFADQGLLYHWTKYEEKSVSIVFKKYVENWGVSADGKVHLEEKLDLYVFQGLSMPHACWKKIIKFKPCQAPHSDYVHFTGKSKPWLAGPPDDFDDASGEASAAHYWYHILSILNDKLKIGLDFKKWRKKHRPFLGMFPQSKHIAGTRYASREGKDDE